MLIKGRCDKRKVLVNSDKVSYYAISVGYSYKDGERDKIVSERLVANYGDKSYNSIMDYQTLEEANYALDCLTEALLRGDAVHEVVNRENPKPVIEKQDYPVVEVKKKGIFNF